MPATLDSAYTQLLAAYLRGNMSQEQLRRYMMADEGFKAYVLEVDKAVVNGWRS